MKELSVFIDESGDFGKVKKSNPTNAAVSSDCQAIMNMVDKIKKDRKVGVRYMKACELEDVYREQGREEGKKQMTIQLHKDNVPDEIIAKAADVSIDTVKAWIHEENA